jgi:hypothetical protein
LPGIEFCTAHRKSLADAAAQAVMARLFVAGVDSKPKQKPRSGVNEWKAREALQARQPRRNAARIQAVKFASWYATCSSILTPAFKTNNA